MMGCPNCGRRTDETDAICQFCGTSLGTTADNPASDPAGQGRPDRSGPGGEQRQQHGPQQRQPRQGSPQGGQPSQSRGVGGRQQPRGGDTAGLSRRALLAAGGVGVVAVGGGALFLLGGGGNEGIRSVIQENAEAFEDGAVDRYMRTMHPASPVYDRTRSQLESLLRQVPATELTVTVTVESVETLGEGHAEAEVLQTTRANVQGFRDNRVRQTNGMRTYQGEWRIYDSTIEDVEYL